MGILYDSKDLDRLQQILLGELANAKELMSELRNETEIVIEIRFKRKGEQNG